MWWVAIPAIVEILFRHLNKLVPTKTLLNIHHIFLMQQSFETENLNLTLLTRDDAAFIISIVNSEGWLKFIGDRNIHTAEAALAYIDKILNTPDFYYWVVSTKEENIPVGIISFVKRDYLENFDIGFALLAAYSGKGYALEAAKVVLEAATAAGYTPVLGTTMMSNKRSIKLLLTLGFHFDREIETSDLKLMVYSNAKPL